MDAINEYSCSFHSVEVPTQPLSPQDLNAYSALSKQGCWGRWWDIWSDEPHSGRPRLTWRHQNGEGTTVTPTSTAGGHHGDGDLEHKASASPQRCPVKEPHTNGNTGARKTFSRRWQPNWIKHRDTLRLGRGDTGVDPTHLAQATPRVRSPCLPAGGCRGQHQPLRLQRIAGHSYPVYSLLIVSARFPKPD